MTSQIQYISGRNRIINHYVVDPQHELCSRCNTYGHSHESTTCPTYNTSINYCHPSLTKHCSRCNQPGHNRNNRRKCSLYNSYRNYSFEDIYSELRRIDARHYVNDMCEYRKISNIIYDAAKIMKHADAVLTVGSRTNDPEIEDDILYMRNGFYRIHEQCQLINNRLTIINVRDTANTQRLYDNIERLHNDVLEILERLPINILFMITHECLNIGFYPSTRYHSALAYREYSQMNQLNTPTAQIYPKVSIIKQEILDLTETIHNCSVCFEDIKQDNICLTNCKHMFCVNCIQTYHKTLHTKLIMPCPMCRTSIVNVSSSSNVIKF